MTFQTGCFIGSIACLAVGVSALVEWEQIIDLYRRSRRRNGNR